MSSISNAVLKKCLLESTLAEIKEIEALDYDNVKATDTFKERIKNTIAGERKVKKKYSAKKVVLIFVAAILVSLLIAFSVSAGLRKVVANFYVEVHDKFTEFVIVKENELDTSMQGSVNNITQSLVDNTEQDSLPPEQTFPTTIEVEYKPSYIDENGYFELEKFKYKQNVVTMWTNGTEIIDLTQMIIDGTTVSINTENAEYQTIYIGSHKTFCVLRDNTYHVQWLAYGYLFGMGCDASLGWEEVEKIVLSVKPVTE